MAATTLRDILAGAVDSDSFLALRSDEGEQLLASHLVWSLPVAFGPHEPQGCHGQRRERSPEQTRSRP